MNDRRAFIAGSTGYTGRALVSVLCARGFEVTAHIRPGSTERERLGAQFEAEGARVDSTPWELSAMTQTLRTCTPSHVFALLGTTRKRARTEGMNASEGYEKIDYGLTSLLIEALVRSGVDARFVYLSAAGVRERTSNPYLRARARIEAELRNSSVRWTVARPSFIAGDREESRRGEAFGARLADGILSLAGTFGAAALQDRYRSITGRELAEGLADAAVDPAAEGHVLHTERLRRFRDEASNTAET